MFKLLNNKQSEALNKKRIAITIWFSKDFAVNVLGKPEVMMNLKNKLLKNATTTNSSTTFDPTNNLYALKPSNSSNPSNSKVSKVSTYMDNLLKENDELNIRGTVSNHVDNELIEQILSFAPLEDKVPYEIISRTRLDRKTFNHKTLEQDTKSCSNPSMFLYRKYSLAYMTKHRLNETSESILQLNINTHNGLLKFLSESIEHHQPTKENKNLDCEFLKRSRKKEIEKYLEENTKDSKIVIDFDPLNRMFNSFNSPNDPNNPSMQFEEFSNSFVL